MSLLSRKTAPAGSELSADTPSPLGPTSDFEHVATADKAVMARVIFGLTVALLASTGLNIVQGIRYRPTPVFVDVRTGRKVVEEAAGATSASSQEATTALFLQNIAEQFIKNRYAYEPVNLENKLEAALALMEESAAEKERDRIKALPLADVIIAAEGRYSITLDEGSWDMLQQPGDSYRVSVRGRVSVTNATVYRDKPFAKDVTFTLILKRVAQTKENLTGLVVIDPGTDIL